MKQRYGKSIELKPGTVVTAVVPYPPVTGNHAVRHAQGRHYRTDRANEYRDMVWADLRRQGLVGPEQMPLTNLRVRIALRPPDRRARDADNVIKEISDALTKAGFWADDSNKVIKSWAIDWLDAVPSGLVSITVEGWRAA